MNQNILCQYPHKQGQEKIISVCLNPQCEKKLLCCFCYADYHRDHVVDCLTIGDFLEQHPQPNEIQNFQELINFKKNQISNYKENLMKTVEMLEQLFNIEMESAQQIINRFKDAYENIYLESNIKLILEYNDPRKLDKEMDMFSQQVQGFYDTIKEFEIELEKQLCYLMVDKYIRDDQLIKLFKSSHYKFDSHKDKQFTYKLFENDLIYYGQLENEQRHGKGIAVFDYIQFGIWNHNILEEGIFIKNNNHNKGCLFYGKFNPIFQGKLLTSEGDEYEGQFEQFLKTGQGKYKFKDGRVFEGLFENDVFIKGKLIYPNGDIYEGEVSEIGNKQGKGLYVKLNGDKYDCIWRDDIQNGIGSYTNKLLKECYQGEFKDGKYHGQGKFKWSNDDTYDGEWQDGCMQGRGIKVWIGGEFYEGYWKKGMKDGYGVLKENNRIYEGEWFQNKRHGQGKQTYDQNEIYDGQWLEDKRQGKGVYIYSGGARYDGLWENDEQSEGTYLYTNGAVFKGQFKAQSSKGIITYENGDKYEGELYNMLRQGSGTMTYKCGDIYEGEWENDLYEGKGILRWDNGDQYRGQFSKGKRQGRGILKYRNDQANNDMLGFMNGFTFKGNWYQDKRSGQGMVILPNGDKELGEWINDFRVGIHQFSKNDKVVEKRVYNNKGQLESVCVIL